MFLHALSEPTWKKGLNLYLKDMALKAATSQDLSRNLQESVTQDNIDLSGLTMDQIVENWARSPGYPVLHVALTTDNRLNFTQNEFRYSDKQPRNVPVWLIPVTVASETRANFSHTQAQLWVRETIQFQSRLPERGLEWDADDWILVNLQQSGYYRVNYEPQLWDRIIRKLNSESYHTIPHATRAQLLDDAFNLARAELLDYITVFRLLEYLQKEHHFLPWDSVSRSLTYINTLLVDTEAFNFWNRYVQQLVAPLYDHFGLRDLGNSENWGDKRARATGIAWACRTGYSTCQQEAERMVLAAVEDPSKEIHLDLQQTIYCAGLRASGTGDFLRVWAKQQATPDALSAFRTRLLRGLGCNESPENQKVYLETTMSTNTSAVRYLQGEYAVILNSVYTSSATGLHSAIDFLFEHGAAADLKYGGIKDHTANIARRISTTNLQDRYRNLTRVLRNANIITSADEEAYLTITQTNLDWTESNQQEIFNYLGNYFNSAGNRLSILSGLLSIVVAAFINHLF